MQIEQLIENKNVLMIPVYSTRSYETGIYDLLADGNISKFLMKLLRSNAKSVDILYPDKSTGIEAIKTFIENNVKYNVNWIPFEYGENAHQTRNMGIHFYNYILKSQKKYDRIVSEVDTLAYETIMAQTNVFCHKDNFLYWAGSWTADGARWDDIEHSEMNRKIASEIVTACLLPGQVDLYGGRTFYDECVYNPKYFDKNIVFFPFRLSDNSYHLKEFKNIIKEIYNEGIRNFIVLYTDVNDSKLLDDEDKNIFIKVPQNKFVYQAILKGKPIIPYLDDITKNYHSNIYEFIYYGCDVIMLKNDIFKNTTQIENIEELKNVLKEKIGG